VYGQKTFISAENLSCPCFHHTQLGEWVYGVQQKTVGGQRLEDQLEVRVDLSRDELEVRAQWLKDQLEIGVDLLRRVRGPGTVA